MAVFRLLSINSPSNTGTQTYTHSLGVVPKAAIVFSQGEATLNSTVNNARLLMGFTDGSAQYSVSLFSQHNVSLSNSSRVVSNSLIHQVGVDQTTIIRADLIAWSATDLTLNWTTVQSTSRRVYLLLIGGEDVSAKALLIQSPTATGNQIITGTGFAPDLALFLNASTVSMTLGSPATHGAFGFGLAERLTLSQWAVAVAIEGNASPSDTYRAQRTDRCVLGLSSLTGSQLLSASLSSWDPDGVTLNWTSVTGSSRPIPALFLKGLSAKAFSFMASTSSGSQAITTVGFQPKAIILASFFSGSTTSTISNAALSIGCATSTATEQSLSVFDQDNLATTSSYSYHATNRVLVEHGTGLVRAADLVSLDSNGFTLSWSASGAAVEIVGLALADSPQREASETVSFTAAEATSLLARANVVDTDVLELSVENAAIVPIEQLVASEAGALSLSTEASQVVVPTSTNDTGTFALTEGVANLLTRSTRVESGTVAATDTASLLVRSTRVESGTLATTETTAITSLPWDLGPLRLEVGPPQSAPTITIFPVLRATTHWELNDIGSFSAQFPVTAAGADRVDAGQEVRIIRQGEGEIFRGLIASRRVVLESDGPVVEIEGYSTARELSWRTTQLNWRVQNQAIVTAIDAMVAGTGWTSTVDSAVAGQLVTAEFQGVTRFEAISALAQQVYRHVRPMPVERRIEVTKGEEESGLRCVLLSEWPYGETDETLLPITRIRISRRDDDIVTRVIPLGAGEGPNALTLRWSTRTSPYPIRTMTGPDGQLIYYLEDTTASSTYGVRERVVAFKDVAPLANSSAELERAANALYDLAAAWLQARSRPRVEWAVQVAGPFRQRDPRNGQWRLVPGHLVRLIARGIVEDWDGKRVFLDLDTNAFVRGIERRFDGDAEEVSLVLTDSSRVVRDDDLLADVVERLWAVAVAQKIAPAIDRHGPVRQSGNAGNPVILDVVWDQNVRFLHKAILTITCRRVRSNVQTAAAGGGSTVTSSSGGGTTTTSAGGSGSITLTASGGAHQHDVARTQNLTAWSDPGFREQVVWADSSAGTGYGVYVGRDNTTPTNAILRMTVQGDHTHDVSGMLSNHTHSVSIPSHTHNVTIPSHTHDLVYGIYEAPYPSGLQLSLRINGVDVTSALGGPWSPSQNSTLRLDVTQFLQEPDGRPKQTSNRVEVLTNSLVDIDVSLYAIVAIATIVPVGVV